MSVEVVEAALCPAHALPARGTCERCGAFTCETCPPGRWCAPCGARIQELHADGGGAVVLPGLTMATLGGLSLFLAVYLISQTWWAGPARSPDVAEAVAEEPGIFLLLTGLPLVFSLLMTVAGIQMARNRAYRLALVGATVSLLNLGSVCWLISLGVGIWSLVVLRRPDVRAVFAAERERGRG